jgi:hypothetical protein
MDNASINVVAFIDTMQDARNELHSVWNHFARRRLKVSSESLRTGPIWALAGYFDFGFMVTGGDGRNYDLSARLRWKGEEWVIEADICLEEEDEKQNWSYPTLRELPVHRTEDWPTAVQYLHAAIGGLIELSEIIPS